MLDIIESKMMASLRATCRQGRTFVPTHAVIQFVLPPCRSFQTAQEPVGICHRLLFSTRRRTYVARRPMTMNLEVPRERSPLSHSEREQLRTVPKPYPKADIAAMSPQEREALRLRSKAIPLVVSHEPLDIIFEDDVFLVVSKPSWLKMHPIHRFQGS